MRNICFFTGTRAEFGLLRPLIQKFQQAENFNVQIVALAMHLSPEFGLTYKEIEAAGFTIDKKIESLVSADTASGINKSIALAQIGIADALEELKPDIAVILGDRTEMLAAATCCAVSNIPISHLHGGEVTEGAYDDSIRHAITKMSYWHFASTEVYRKRIIQLGEHPKRVFNVGAIGLDSVKNLELLNKTDFEKSIDFSLAKKNILITYHPVTLENNSSKHQIETILSTLDDLEDTHFIFTLANSDKEGRIINEVILKYVSENKNKAKAFQSLGQLRYLSAIQHVDMVLGNSSSGVLEVPAFHTPTINIGDRQRGREMSKSVINVAINKGEIEKAIQKAFSSSFIQSVASEKNKYGNGTASDQIFEIIRMNDNINLKKGFFDLKAEV